MKAFPDGLFIQVMSQTNQDRLCYFISLLFRMLHDQHFNFQWSFGKHVKIHDPIQGSFCCQRFQNFDLSFPFQSVRSYYPCLLAQIFYQAFMLCSFFRFNQAKYLYYKVDQRIWVSITMLYQFITSFFNNFFKSYHCKLENRIYLDSSQV